MKTSYSKNRASSSSPILFLICALTASTIAAIVFTNIEEKSNQKRRLKEELANQLLISEEIHETYITNVVQPVPAKLESSSSATKTTIAPAPTAVTSASVTQPATTSSGGGNLPGYTAIKRTTGVVSVPTNLKKARPVEGRRIAFP